MEECPLKNVLAITALALLLGSSQVMAGSRTAVGYFDGYGPAGIRTWITHRVGVDLGAGYRGTNDGTHGTLSDYSVSAGVPITLKEFDKLRVNFRPGVGYDSADAMISATEKTQFKTLAFNADLEFEASITENVTVSAGAGFDYTSSKLDQPGQQTFKTFGLRTNNFYLLGFHVYLW
jgi:hypothetical protein